MSIPFNLAKAMNEPENVMPPMTVPSSIATPAVLVDMDRLEANIGEMAQAAAVGIDVDLDRVRVLPGCEEFCRALGLDPMGLIASGSLLAAVASADVSGLLDALALEGIVAYEIGRVTAQDEGLKLRTADGIRELPRFERDELARFLGG